MNKRKFKRMKKIFYLAAIVAAVSLTASCGDSKNNKTIGVGSASDSTDNGAGDSTIYGVCGEGSGMSSMQVITNEGDTLDILIDNSDEEFPTVKGGVFSGDRMAVIASKQDGEWVATQAINVSSLIGRWTSLDKDFEIQEGGLVKSSMKAETNPWTSWKIFNGKLVLNRDTFEVDNLGSDSLYLENKEGIFTFKRKK